jgi:hypothetical protein
MVIKNKFNLEDVVRLKTDPDALPRIITAIQINVQGNMMYGLACAETTSFHYEIEITKESLYEYQMN